MTSTNSPSIFLVDNGSLRPEATFALRSLAASLSKRVSMEVQAVSLLHSHKIPVEDLDGVAATIVKRRMRELIAEGERDFLILPLFLGPSLAITDYLPKVIDELRSEATGLNVCIADAIAGADVEHPDPRLSLILKDHVEPMLSEDPGVQLALIDHGTPIRPVNRLRNAVAAQLSAQLGRPVQACSMERREGSEYEFNEPLLENLTGGERCLALAMFFLLPGRHAGPNGDVATIAEGLKDEGRFENVMQSSLLGEHPLLLEILADRLNAAL